MNKEHGVLRNSKSRALFKVILQTRGLVRDVSKLGQSPSRGLNIKITQTDACHVCDITCEVSFVSKCVLKYVL